MASVTMSTIAIVVAIAAFIFLSMKGVGPLITAVLAAAFVSLFTEAGFVQSFFTDFLSGVTSMVGNMFFLLVLGAISAACCPPPVPAKRSAPRSCA